MQQSQPQSPKLASVQPKLKVNEPGDRYEREADAMADTVMRMIDDNRQQSTSKPVTGLIGRSIQRKCANCEEEEKKNKLMRKEQNGVSGAAVSSSFSSSLSNAGQGMPLQPGIKQKMEHAFNTDFSPVRIHTGHQAAALNNAVQAKAFTYGNDIYFNKGEYKSDTYEGKKLLAHELTHVVQQNSGGIQRKIMRQVADPNVIEFTEAGNRYRITRTTVPETVTTREAEPPRVRFGMDDTDLYLNIAWCSSSVRGNVRFGANVPEQARNLFSQIMSQISSGATPDEIRATVLGTDITPFLRANIARSAGWEVTGEVHVTVDRTGITGGGGGLTLRIPNVDISATVEGSREGGITGRVTATIPLGRPETFTCRADESVSIHYRRSYNCEQWRRRMEDRTRQVPVTDRESRYIYFNYANEVVDEARSLTEVQELTSRLREGYHVVSITGFTSPEGPRARRRGSRFVGNDQLSIDRANAALHRVEQIVQELNLGGAAISGVDTSVIPLGDSELYPLDRTTPGGATVEVEGTALEQHTEQEFKAHSEEDRHRAATETQLQAARTPQQRADAIYPPLRRAVVVLTRDRTETQHYQEEVEGFVPIDCATIPNYDTHISSFRIQDAVR